MRVLISLVLLVVAIGFLFLGSPDQKTPIKPDPKDQVVFKIYEGNEICEVERNEITAIEERPYAVENANSLRFWKVALLKSEKFNFITEQEDPFLKGQAFILASGCQPLTEAQQKENSKLLDKKQTNF